MLIDEEPVVRPGRSGRSWAKDQADVAARSGLLAGRCDEARAADLVAHGERADVRADAVADEARLAVGDVDRLGAQRRRERAGREPALECVEEQPEVDLRVDV